MSATRGRGFDRLLTYIEESMGFATSMYNDAYLDRRISARMRRNDTDGYRAYQRLLESNDGEQQELLDTLSVNVTSFFRNPDVWEALRPVLRELTATGRTKVWSAACSDGREAYSLAMLAHDDPQVREDRIRITGTDIKQEILRKATRGEYHASETNDLEEQLAPIGDYGRYIERNENSYRVVPSLRRMVTFQRRDLIRESPPDEFDLVLCRNLFIYIDSDAKRAVFETLGTGLRPDGYLTIGMTETVPANCRSWFEPVEKRLRIYRNVR
jgi:chemotaxis protein methyltransferase CheR